MEESRPYEDFKGLAPQSGWLADYLAWTMGSEAPMVYHFMVGVCILGASFGRNIFFNKGYYHLFPNMQILLIGPTGRVRKTSAINLGMSILRKTNIHVVSNKTTPEGFVDAISGKNIGPDGKLLGPKDAHSILVAPELAVLLGKQKYNEGMIQILTDLFDSPNEWQYNTKGGGLLKVTNATLAMLGASTPDWLITAIPQDAFGGGFMSRLLLVVQQSTNRCYPIPEPPSSNDHLIKELVRLAPYRGQMELQRDALEWYTQWYASTRKAFPEDEKMAGYHERKPDHMLRLGMVLARSERLESIPTRLITQASAILAFLEKEMLETFKWLGIKPAGQDQERILRIIKANERIRYEDLAAKLVYFMNARTLQDSLKMLVDGRLVIQHIDSHGMWYTTQIVS